VDVSCGDIVPPQEKSTSARIQVTLDRGTHSPHLLLVGRSAQPPLKPRHHLRGQGVGKTIGDGLDDG
jgi:hypothetical protein